MNILEMFDELARLQKINSLALESRDFAKQVATLSEMQGIAGAIIRQTIELKEEIDRTIRSAKICLEYWNKFE